MASSSGRRRPRKVGLSRMDAALDYLNLQLGFPEQDIRSTVKALLKVYGGNEAWRFLEEDSYKLVVDAILEQQDTIDKEPSPPQLPPPKNTINEESPLPEPAPPKNTINEELPLPELPVPPSPQDAMPQEREEEQQQNGGSDIAIEFMDGSVLNVVPGRSRAPFYGYLSETDSDASDFDSDNDVGST